MHVSVLAPSLSFPSAAVTVAGTAPSSTLIPCPSCPTPPAEACTASLELPTLHRCLTPANRANYERAVHDALSRALGGGGNGGPGRSHAGDAADADDEVLRCPFCPFTAVRPRSFPLALPLGRPTWSGLLALPLAVAVLALFMLATVHAPALLAFLPPAGPFAGAENGEGEGEGEDEASVFAPLTTLVRSTAHVKLVVRRAAHRLGGPVLRCRARACGRLSCVACGGEVWEGEAECGCLAGGGGGRSKKEGKEGADEGEKGGQTDEKKEKEELRLVVERAMTEAAVRTVRRPSPCSLCRSSPSCVRPADFPPPRPPAHPPSAQSASSAS